MNHRFSFFHLMVTCFCVVALWSGSVPSRAVEFGAGGTKLMRVGGDGDRLLFRVPVEHDENMTVSTDCAWVGVSAGNSGENSEFIIEVEPNRTGVERSAELQVAGRSYSIIQYSTGPIPNDVSSTIPKEQGRLAETIGRSQGGEAGDSMAVVSAQAVASPGYGNTYRMDSVFSTVLSLTGSEIYTLTAATNGGAYAGGWFYSTQGGLLYYNISKLTSDGSIDIGFNMGAGFDDAVHTVVIQSDQRIVVGGWFANFNGVARNGIARLNVDGTLDSSFDPGTGFERYGSVDYGTVNALTVQPDRRVLVGGWFRGYNGTPRNGIARLNINGTLDTTFDPGTGFAGSGSVNSVVLQPDGRVLVGGGFTSFNDTERKGIVRLNTNGTLDTTFDPGTGFDGYGTVSMLVLQPDGRIIVGGGFMSFNGTARSGIARLNTNGTLDTTFDPGTGFDGYGSISSLVLQSDGRILVGGWFTQYNGTACNGIVRLNADGGIDRTFVLPDVTSLTVYGIAFADQGRLLLSGASALADGVRQNGLVVLKPDFSAGSSSSSSGSSPSNGASGGGGGAMGLWVFVAMGVTALAKLLWEFTGQPTYGECRRATIRK